MTKEKYEIINSQPMLIKEYNGQRVVTFKDIDLVHSRPSGTAKRNFNKNRQHFIENVDYFKITPYEFRTAIGEMDLRQQNDITLVTETGYLMLVKSFRDELSWQIQRQLVNNYFKGSYAPTDNFYLDPIPLGEPYDYTGKTIYEKILERENKLLKKENIKLNNRLELKSNDFKPINKGSEKTMDYSKEEIKRHLIDYVEEITTKSKGHNQYVCPFCNSGNGKNGTGAFTVYPDTNSYYCFACQASGDVYSIYARMNNLNIKSDLELIQSELTKRYNVIIDNSNKPTKEIGTNSEQKKTEKDYTKFFKVAQQHLSETDYLTKRGISFQTQQRFNCGYVSNFMYKGNQSTSAVIVPTSSTSFMWRSTTENIKQKRGSAHILNAVALNQPYCFVVEGEIDCMSIEDCGFACIGLGSTSNIKKIFNFDTSKTVLIIAMDNDTAGRKAKSKLIKLCEEHEVPYIITPNDVWSDYKDANELLVHDRQTLIKTLVTLSECAKMLDIEKHYQQLKKEL